MKNKRTIAVLLTVVCLLALPAWPQSDIRAGQVPVVRKIEPPNWWVSYTPELNLLLTGQGLSGTRVESATAGVAVLGAHGSANGHYFFVNLRLSPGLKPGNVSLRLLSAGGSTKVSLPLLARADSRG